MREFLRRVRYALQRRRFEAELSEELELHRAMRQEEIEAGGVPPIEAAAQTRRAMGHALLASDRARDVWITPWLQDAAKDARFAVRMFAKERRLTIAAVLALALGIGATNTVFTLVNTLLIRDLPFDRADQLVAIALRLDQRPRPRGLTYEDLREWQASATTFSAIGASTHGTGTIVSGDDAPATRYRGQYVTANLFPLLRREPIVGRQFRPEDERPGAPAVVMIGHAIWQERYGADPRVIGRTIRVNDRPATIVGVMPPGFAYSFTTELWLPISQWPDFAASRRGGPGLDTVARVADSSDLTAARAEAEAIAQRLARAYPATNTGTRASIEPLNQGAMQASLPMLLTLMGAVAFVLLVACANVANLLLARAALRAREMAVRASLGATRGRLVRQLLIECLLLAALAGALGAWLSVHGARFLGTAFNAMEIAAPADAAKPYWVDLSMNGSVLLFLTGLILATTLAFGLAPAWHVSRTNTNALLKEDGRGSSGSRRARRLTSAFTIAQVALTLVLLSGAGLLARSFFTLYYADYRVPDPSRLLMARLALPPGHYDRPDARARFYAALDERLAARPSAASATMASVPPFDSFGAARTLAIEGRTLEPSPDGKAPRVSYVSAGARYFETLGLRVSRGRTLAKSDAVRGHEGAVVNERFAALFFPGGNALGQRIRLTADSDDAPPHAALAARAAAAPASAPRRSATASAPTPVANANSAATGAPIATESADTPWLTIVGILPNLPRPGSRREPEPEVYAPLAIDPAPPGVVMLLARAPSGLAPAVGALRDAVRALDADVPLYSIEPMSAAIARGRMPQVLIGGFLGGIAFIALVLASVGLYALTAQGVSQRTQEIGIRMALGARASQVVWLFARRTIVHLAVGLALGLGGALAVGKLLQSLLVQTAPRDPLTLTLVALLLVSVALAAAFFPARRAAHLDPMTALREE